MIAMALSVSAVLAISFAGQPLRGEGIETDFSVDADDAGRDIETKGS